MLRLKELRLENGITQTKLAEYLHTKQNTYSQYESGHVQVPVNILILLADYYKVSIDYLLGRTEL